jgi:Zn-dependent protease with chaperone function
VARRSIPYPPSPRDYPDELTRPTRESAATIVAVIAGLGLFLLVYAGLMVACLAVIILTMTSLPRLPFPLLWILASIPAAGFAFVLIKGLFVREAADKSMHVEIEEEDQPVFFAFIQRLTDEIGAPTPNKVFVSPEVNAAVMPELSLLNLFVPPKRNLLVGLGLVNALNLSEFKAVMAHEFGHFSQRTSRLHAYVYLANRTIVNLVMGEDWLDRMIRSARRTARYSDGAGALIAAAFAFTVGGTIWLIRMTMFGIFKLINFTALALSRKEEFHADRIAVSVAGSNAIVHSLYRLKFANESLEEAARELEVAAQHKLYTRDLYYHHTTTAAHLRKIRKKPRLGLPPELKGPKDGRDIQLFDEDDDDSGIPEMWSTHPKDYDREENAKEIFVPAEIDERSPWILFTDKDSLRERSTYKFYRVVFRAKKDIELAPAEEVQGFIDDEHAEIHYDPKYHGAYDERPITPGKVLELNRLVGEEPWDAERIRRVHSRLYLDLGRQAEDLADVRKQVRKIYKKSYGRPRGRDRDRLDDLAHEFNKLSDWFASFDRRVYLVHAYMAKQLGGSWLQELASRYLFQLEIQQIHRDVAEVQDRVEDVVEGLNYYGDELPEGYFEYVQEILRHARKVMETCLYRAREMRTPAMANVKMGTRFDKLIFEGELVGELPFSFIKSIWVNKLVAQVGMMRRRVNRMDFKCFGAVLHMQDRMAAEWMAQHPATANGETLPELEIGDGQAARTLVPPPLPKRG